MQTNEQNLNLTSNEEIKMVLIWLQETFPKTFVPWRKINTPLKIGIHHDVIEHLKNEKAPLSNLAIRRAIGAYVNHFRYQCSLVAGNARIDLNGEVVGQVTEEEEKVAKNKIKNLKKKLRKKKIIQENVADAVDIQH